MVPIQAVSPLMQYSLPLYAADAGYAVTCGIGLSAGGTQLTKVLSENSTQMSHGGMSSTSKNPLELASAAPHARFSLGCTGAIVPNVRVTLLVRGSGCQSCTPCNNLRDSFRPECIDI
jgi:hypothetical protein